MLFHDARQQSRFITIRDELSLGKNPIGEDKAFKNEVTDILTRVRAEGDQALIELSRRYDGLEVSTVADLEVPREHWQRALSRCEPELLRAIKTAFRRVSEYARRELSHGWEFTDSHGTRLGQRLTPIDRVGLYVPGGTAAYPSSVVMGVAPAKVADVGEIIVVTPTKQGKVSDTVLCACAVAGVDRVFGIGGAQAIAALTWGTQTIPSVDKICGPGNKWVAEAKRQVYGRVGIDMIAGPSEIVVVADGKANPKWVAADLLAQAEHDIDARAILVSEDRELLDSVQRQIQIQLEQLERADIAREAIENNGYSIWISDLAQAFELVNAIAPEHLQLLSAEAENWLPSIRHAGAIFIGEWSAEVFSDYCAGPNHILPTMRCARFSSPLGAYDFQKRSTVLLSSESAIQPIIPSVIKLAQSEGLTAHAEAARMRLDK